MIAAAQIASTDPIWLSDLLQSLEGFEVVGGELYGLHARGVALDSRLVQPNDIFVAVTGTAHQGKKYVKDAVKKGAAAILTHKGHGFSIWQEIDGKVPIFEVNNPRKAAAYLACAFEDYPSTKLDLIGITGTNGKTTITYLLESILNRAGLNPGVIGTVNCRHGDWSLDIGLTTPDSITLQKILKKMVDRKCQTALLEVSSHALDQHRVAGCKFKVAVFTNLTRDHLDYHKNLEDYFQAKSRLFTEYAPEVSVINIDDSYGQNLSKIVATKTITYSLSKGADVYAVKAKLDLSGIKAEVHTPAHNFEINSRLIGKHNLSNILAAIAASLALNIDPSHIVQGINSLEAIPGRLEKVTAPKGVTALIDYAHTPDALHHILTELKPMISGRLICVIGCGGDRDKGKRPMMGLIAAENADLAIFTSDNPRNEEPMAIIEHMQHQLTGKEELLSKLKVMPDRREAITWAAHMAQEGDCVLVAGKGHETYQQIGPNKLPFNDKNVLEKGFKALTLKEVASNIKGKVVSGPDANFITGISTDSRTTEIGDLFVPIKGPKFDGHKFISKSVEKGSSASLVSTDNLPMIQQELASKGYQDFPLIAVEDTLRGLGDLASYVRKKNKFKVFAITGSCGKTSTKEILHSLLSQRWKSSKTIKNFNNLIGLPLSIFNADIDSEWLVLEMGMNTEGEIARLTEIANPSAALVTNIKPAHLEGLGSIEAIAREKLALFQGISSNSLAVVNLDDPFIKACLKDLPCKTITYSMDSTSQADVVCINWHLCESGSTALFSLKGYELEVTIPLLGKAAINNCLAACAAAYGLGLTLKEIRQGLANLKPVDGRFNLLTSPSGMKIIDDAYNANPASMKEALETLSKLAANEFKVAMLGDMFELGPQASILHQEVGEKAGSIALGLLVAVGHFAHDIKRGAESAGLEPEKIKTFSNTDEFLSWLEQNGKQTIPNHSTVLIKGSRAMRMEKAVALLKAWNDLNGEKK